MQTKSWFLILISLFLSIRSNSQNKNAYQIYNNQGKKVTYKQMLQLILKADFIFIGEYHNNPISHWFEYEITSDVFLKKQVIMGAEMFESDNQSVVDQFLSGKTNQKGLDTTARLWPNYKTDYAPLLNFAKENKIKFIATNVPRRYASLMSKRGVQAVDSLPDSIKKWMVPLPFIFDSTIQCYRDMKELMGAHSTNNIIVSQAFKDATMAYFIYKNYINNYSFIHYNGTWHSDRQEGIVWYLKKYFPEKRILVITTVTQKNVSRLENENKRRADFIICVDEDMTTTY